jgi:hypothetical protein
MSFTRDELLRPSLEGSAVAKAPYSTRTTFLTAFFGGPLAAIAITALNSVRLQRVMRDLAPLGAALVAYVGFMLVLTFTDWGTSFLAAITEIAGPRGTAYFDRLIALALFGLGYMLHRREQRSSDLMDLTRPNGWIAGLACIALAIALMAGFAAALGSGARS